MSYGPNGLRIVALHLAKMVAAVANTARVITSECKVQCNQNPW